MKLGLQLRLKQTLAPQLIQSLKMLQMPILKLEQTLRHELSVNPMLEEEEEPELTAEQQDSSDEVNLKESEDKLDPQLDKIDWENWNHQDFDEFKVKSIVAAEEEPYERVPTRRSVDRGIYNRQYLAQRLSGGITGGNVRGTGTAGRENR